MPRLVHSLTAAAAVAAALVPAAHASQLVTRGATHVTLAVSDHGEAFVEYTENGQRRGALVWGAINGRKPSAGRRQVQFHIEYTSSRPFANACRPYDGPRLAWRVAACKAPDGSYWALQSWQVDLPDLGFAPWIAEQRAPRLQISHWRGPLARIEAYPDWVYGGRFHQLVGRLTYRGTPVHGFGTTRTGAVLDSYGRNLYLDTYDSAYGSGWRRENGFVAHNPNGNICYGFYPHDPTRGGYVHPPGATGERPAGNGARYRLSVQGPGVTPDVTWDGHGLPDYDPNDPELADIERRVNAINDRLAANDRLCQEH